MKSKMWLTLFVAGGLACATAWAQGPLNPSSGPTEIMKTLTQIEPRLAITNASINGSALELDIPGGSYYLTRDIQQQAQGNPVIRVVAPDVTLDLNGFEVIGESSSFDGDGIRVEAPNVVIRNGAIRSCGGSGVQSSVQTNLLVENVSFVNCYAGIESVATTNGIFAEGMRVKQCTFESIASWGIIAARGSIIEGCTMNNVSNGIFAAAFTRVQGNHLVGTGASFSGIGIQSGSGALVLNNTVSEFRWGIEMSSVCIVRDNTVTVPEAAMMSGGIAYNNLAVIANNAIHGAQIGIQQWVKSGATDGSVVYGNTISKANGGIYALNSAVVKENRLVPEHNNAAGISVEDQSYVLNNDITNGDELSQGISAREAAVVRGNRVAAVNAGVVINYAATPVLVENNVITMDIDRGWSGHGSAIDADWDAFAMIRENTLTFLQMTNAISVDGVILKRGIVENNKMYGTRESIRAKELTGGFVLALQNNVEVRAPASVPAVDVDRNTLWLIRNDFTLGVSNAVISAFDAVNIYATENRFETLNPLVSGNVTGAFDGSGNYVMPW